MKCEASERKIYTTTNYEIFVFPKWNRGVSNSRVVKMVESIRKVGWMPEPVLVNEKYEVIDGQSRIKALEALDMPVEFCIVKGIGKKECQMLNLFQKNWSTNDYINSYASEGDENYIWLKRMMIRYKALTTSIVQAVAVGKGCDISGASAAVIQEGELNLTEQEKVDAEQTMFYLSRFAETADYVGGRKDKIYSALIFLYKLDGIDKERLCLVVNNARYELQSSGTTIAWLEQIEFYYNKKLAKNNRIDFVHEYKIA